MIHKTDTWVLIDPKINDSTVRGSIMIELAGAKICTLGGQI